MHFFVSIAACLSRMVIALAGQTFLHSEQPVQRSRAMRGLLANMPERSFATVSFFEPQSFTSCLGVS